jgi:hypothetical protein
MSPIPAVLLWVQEIAFDQQRRATVLYGHDFREDFRWLFVDIPPDLFALRCGERLPVRGVEVANVHRSSQGWAWETTTPDRLPQPPFLLTDDSECRSVLRGTVGIRPTAWGRDEVEAQFEELGISPVPVLGCGWFGVVQVDVHDHSCGELAAFSREGVKLQASEVAVSWAGEDEELGRLVIS